MRAMMLNGEPSTIVVIGRNFEVSGEIAEPPVNRLSDQLNEVRRMLILDNVELEFPRDVIHRAADIAINRDQVQMVIPIRETTLASNESERVPKTIRRVRIFVGDHVVEGDLHIAEGSVERLVTAASVEFLPVTDCTLQSSDKTRDFDLILVSRAHISVLIGAPEPDQRPTPAS